MRFIREPNGNEINLIYDRNDDRWPELPATLQDAVDNDPQTVNVVIDSSGRALILEYESIYGRPRIVRLTGYDPELTDLQDLEIEYRYDEDSANSEGNLTSVTRPGPTAAETRPGNRLSKDPHSGICYALHAPPRRSRAKPPGETIDGESNEPLPEQK